MRYNKQCHKDHNTTSSGLLLLYLLIQSFLSNQPFKFIEFILHYLFVFMSTKTNKNTQQLIYLLVDESGSPTHGRLKSVRVLEKSPELSKHSHPSLPYTASHGSLLLAQPKVTIFHSHNPLLTIYRTEQSRVEHKTVHLLLLRLHSKHTKGHTGCFSVCRQQ